ncbi:class I SAM-dependent methyltransferase [Candidatus Acetothermia bacterium]|jgi:SAM-dependent methyltransferase|nr:class I SAM-dependent methyltransferase [Candidatus Acetothermia bacterium]MCI2431307.1 class I SAM-dependent methyltransferase [Candidatus Acetothermia bacterium]MCI2436961.1 class I SAM-dependent methyltransferase [Candidatus Acetothermia bacterium]
MSLQIDKLKRNRMYDEFAHLWPWISAPEGYAEEARFWRDALREELGPGRHHILELGVGGGNNLSHLTKDFQATAVDLSEKMLAHSKKLNPGVEYIVGDMRTIRLDRKFKAVIIHDAISYMLTEDDLRATFATAAAHLEPGGVFITAPDWFKETFPGLRVSHKTRANAQTELTYFEYAYDSDPNDSVMETILIYFIRERGQLRVEEDLHVTGLFPIQTWVNLMTEAGFVVEKKEYPVHDDPRQAYLLAGVKTR